MENFIFCVVISVSKKYFDISIEVSKCEQNVVIVHNFSLYVA